MIFYLLLIASQMAMIICGTTASTSGNSSVSSGPENYEKFECFPAGGQQDRTAFVDDCYKTLILMPHNSPDARFRQTGGSPHKYILPQTFWRGSCSVRVEIEAAPRVNDETSSWTSIGLTATQLIGACQVAGRTTVGGWINAGDQNLLKITIQNTGFRGAGSSDQNMTLIDSGRLANPQTS